MRGRARRSALAGLAAVVALLVGSGSAWATPAHPNDPGFPLQWNLAAIGAPEAWASATGQGTIIAVVDSGIDLKHEDLAGKIVGHVSCLNTNGKPDACDPAGGDDDDGHGTHVAGIAAATTDNGRGVAGVAPDARLLDVKALQESCDVSGGCTASGNADDVAAAIAYAADHGATVINLSLGNTVQSVFGPSFSAAIEYAWGKGAIPVVAAGNDFVLPSGFGNEPAIVVGALNRAGTRASYANNIGDAKWAIMAPGGESDTPKTCHSKPEGVLSTYFHNGYACLAGTSMAAPHVSGAAALLRGLGLSPQQTVDRLLGTAKQLGAPAVYGAGALDVAAAVRAPVPPAAGDNADANQVTPLSNAPSPPPNNDAGNAAPAASDASPATVPPGPPAAVGLPLGDAAGRVTANNPGDGRPIPAGLVVADVLLASTVACGNAWLWVRRPLSRPQ